MRDEPRLPASPYFQLIVALASAALAVVSAFSMIDEVRLVEILLLFFGGFGAGAGLTAALTRYRRRDGQTQQRKREPGEAEKERESVAAESPAIISSQSGLP